ncbi:MAG: toprim domain-containing protein [Patescibacteria group bacterium]
MDTHVPAVSITAEDIKGVPSPSPEFLRWAWDAWRRDRLDTVVAVTILTGKVHDPISALGYLNDVVKDATRRGLSVYVEDIRPSKPGGYLYGQVRRIALSKRSEGLAPWLRHGQYSHQAITDLFSGCLPKLNADRPTSMNHQFPLFRGMAPEEVIQREFIFNGLTSPAIQTRMILKAVDRLWHRMCHRIGTDWERWHSNIRTLEYLYSALKHLYGTHLARIERTGPDPGGNLLALTVMTWAAAASYFRLLRSTVADFSEIPIIDSPHRFHGGRVDAIRVRAINHKPPSRQARRIIAQMSRNQEHFTSTGHLLRELYRYFGKHLEVDIIDWKFLAGDVLRWDSLLSDTSKLPDVTKEPMSRHKDQMMRYATLVPFDYNLQENRSETWDPHLRIDVQGELWYFLPTSHPVIHPVVMSPEEKAQYFADEIVQQWPDYKERADIRITSNLLMGHLIRLHEIRETTAPNHKDNGSPQKLLDQHPRRLTAFEIIEALRLQQRKFADPETKIIEITGRKKGNDVYEMDFGALLAAIGTGTIRVGHFSLHQGGKVSCMMPDQADSTPSMHIYLANARFHCYGCGTSGKIQLETIPEDIASSITIQEWRGRKSAMGKLPTIPPEHNEIMRHAQELLAEAYQHTPEARRYITKQRGIDESLAQQHGVGFGDDRRLINGLIDMSHDLDELVRYGFFPLAANVTPSHPVVRILRERGMTITQIERPLTEHEGRLIMGLPYSVLSGRVTFPLSLEGRWTNFYGRAITPGDKRFTHRKLPTNLTEVEQGGFNMRALTSDAPEVLVTEGIMDALSLIMMGHQTTLAVVGVGNHATVASIARTNKDVAIALDNDTAGRKGTPKLAEALKQFGLLGTTRDFTKEFLRDNPGTYKDYNQWLVEQFLPNRRVL